VTTLLIVDRVLMRVVVGREAWWGSKEVFKRSDIDGGIKYGERSSSG